MGTLSGLNRVVSTSGNIRTGAALCAVYLYSRLQARTGTPVLAQPNQPSGRSALASSRLARRAMQFRMRDGARVRCRLVDAGSLLSVNVDGDYDLPGIDWASMRAIVDIGAHVGTFTLWAALRAPRARILSVEPNPNTFAFLQRNIADNGLSGRVTAVNAAAGPAHGVGTLELVEHSLGTRLARNGGGSVTAQVETIPDLLKRAGIDQIDFLKLDCEGTEYEIFDALDPETLRRFKAIACEYHPVPGRDVREIARLLRDSGFQVEVPDARLGLIWAAR